MMKMNGVSRTDACDRRGPRALRGFTLIELLIAVVIVGVLTAFAIPSYVKSVQKSRRPDAKQALLDLAAREERYYTLNNTYASGAVALGYATTGTANVSVTLGNSPGDYLMTVSASSATGYTLLATPQNSQVSDSCGSYQLDNFGNQLNIYPTTGTAATIAGCW
jgi:type IV pilus assembly protein PilE